MLKRKTIHIDDLFLDPNNPRLGTSVDANNVKVEDREIEELQKDVRKRLRGGGDDPYGLKELQNSMRLMGFVTIDRVVVRPLSTTNRYVVVEGNRRIASAKLVLEDDDYEMIQSNKLRPGKRKTLERIEAQVLNTKGRSDDDVSAYISKVLGIRHYGSLLEWAPLPKAHNIYQEYMRGRTGDVFQFNNVSVGIVAERFSIKKAEITKALRAYIAYRQLSEVSGTIKDKDYSLIEALVTEKRLRGGYISVDEATYKLSEDSVAKIIELCQFDKRDRLQQTDKIKILRDPKSVGILGRLYQIAEGDEDTATRDYAKVKFRHVTEGVELLEESYNLARSFKRRRRWVETLSELLDKRKKQLVLEEFRSEGNALMYKEELSEKLVRLSAVLGS